MLSTTGGLYEARVLQVLSVLQMSLARRRLERGDGGLDLVGEWKDLCRVGVQCKHRCSALRRRTVQVSVVRELEASVQRWKSDAGSPSVFLGVMASNALLSRDAQRWFHGSLQPLAYVCIDDLSRLTSFRLNLEAGRNLPRVSALKRESTRGNNVAVIIDEEIYEF